MHNIRSVFVATGSYIPELKVSNAHFLNHQFCEKDGSLVLKENSHVIEKFKEITEIECRRYASDDQSASVLGYQAAKSALESSNIDKETLDYIIVAHNFGDVAKDSNRTNIVPSLASRIKQMLQIKNPDCVAYDLAFGCPGWVEALIQANYYIRSGDARRCLVIGTETLSRVIDQYDRDSMLYADGGGAAILEASTSGTAGIIAHKTQTHAIDHAHLLKMDKSYHANESQSQNIYLKMNGRKLYEFALNQVPLVIKSLLDKAGVPLMDIKKVIIHQANGKMDDAILQRLFKLYNAEIIPEGIMPMTISWLGNSSVATIPTLLDLLIKNEIEGQSVTKGDKVLIASVGAGMNINALIYQF
jgi:3-oxoacyl-[acyl-carrier-protein] synthase III